MEQQTPISPKSRMKPREGQKRAIFVILDLGGRGGGGSTILDKIKWNSKPPSPPPPPNQGWSRAKGKNAPFSSSLIWEGGGGGSTILDKVKWNSKPPSPPNQGWSRAKGKNAPFFHLWFGGEGGSRFSIYFVQDCSLVLRPSWASSGVRSPQKSRQGTFA